jgi:hypothetical protein
VAIFLFTHSGSIFTTSHAELNSQLTSNSQAGGHLKSTSYFSSQTDFQLIGSPQLPSRLFLGMDRVENTGSNINSIVVEARYRAVA